MMSAVMMVAASCAGSPGDSESTSSSAKPSSAPPPSATPLTLVYEVDGPGKADLDYEISTARDAEEKAVKLPWRKDITVTDTRAAWGLELIATSYDAKSPLTCRIVLDGKVVDTKSDFPMVFCAVPTS